MLPTPEELDRRSNMATEYLTALEDELEQHRHQPERAKAIKAEIARVKSEKPKKAAKSEKAVEGPPETAA